MSDILQQMRQKTAALHQQLEQHPLFAGLLSPDISFDHLQQVLQLHYRIYQTLEPLLQQHFPDYAPALPCLIHDLQQLGVTPNADPLPAFELPSSTAQHWGMYYVLAGSRLGGQLIARALLQHLQFDSRFFSRDLATQTWGQLKQQLQQTLVSPDQQQQAIHAAQHIFSTFLSAASQTEPPKN